MTEQADMFFEVAELQRGRQFRMRRMQLFNWGTFSDLHDIAIAEEGFLFVGRSGSGKSTLLDALAALLVPPLWLVFNAAAREGERNRKDRNFASYVRGAWGDQKDTGSGEIATRFLRTGTTWSALALTFANREGRHVTLIQLYWIRGTASGNNDVRRHYMIAERPFDIRELQGFDLDIRALKHSLPNVDHLGDAFRPYGERLRRLLGIESEMALKLLHKTQSAKNVGDLNAFLREFMLDEPESFEVADRLVAEFAELDTAHQEVVTARRQVETLQPAREQHERLQAADRRILDREGILLAIDGYSDGIRKDLLAERIEELVTRDRGLEGEETQRSERLSILKEALVTIEDEHRQKGGGRIEELKRQKQEAERQRDERKKRRDQVEGACTTLGWSVPDNAHAFSERLSEARGVVEARRSGREAEDLRRDEMRDEKRAIETEFARLRREIDAMQRQPSNIPFEMLDLRRRIVESIGCAESELPFVGELIQVKEQAAEWHGAIERVLHGFALALLVEDRWYVAVSSYVNENYLGKRLVYHRIRDEISTPAAVPRRQSLVHKLELKETVHRPWLEAEIKRRFDYACVENLRDFRQETRALTREGQVRHGSDRHEKDDRVPVNDRSRWVLGFDNREKFSLFLVRAQELGAKISEAEKQIEALNDARKTQEARYEACLRLTHLDWQDIDAGSMLDRIAEIELQLQRLRAGNRELQKLGERLEGQRAVVAQAQGALEDTRVDRRTIANELAGHRNEHERIAKRLPTIVGPDPSQRQMLDEIFQAKGRVSLKNVDERRRDVERDINKELETLRDERNAAIRKIEQAFAAFKREWPQEGADFDATLHAAPEFLALLQRLEHDGLPRHEHRFFDMLKTQSTENLAALNAHLVQARKEIYARMELVNEALSDAEFNPGTHLQIQPTDRNLDVVKEFREQTKEVLSHAWQMERASAEERFLILRKLVQRLSGQDSEERHWREQVLDVRLHVEFIGVERDSEDREVEIYRSGAGKSGGQREKLATTCLAAALRYQLGGSEGGVPMYGSVVLDEAFGKADNEFTELTMRIFQKFGFQMIVATPLKSVMTLEPFIGGACFVDITDRKRSATLAIEYDMQHQRLKLPTHVHVEDIPA